MKKYIFYRIFFVMSLVSLGGCKDYLNIVPDNVATIDFAFRLRDEAEKYLFTCYNNMPNYNNITGNVGLMGADELTTFYPRESGRGSLDLTMLRIARGEQNVANPLVNFWDGANSGKSYFMALRECNIFLDNIDKVYDITLAEKTRWIAEVKFLKAFYHYWLVKMYGPIPIIRQNLPISSSVEQVKVYRDPVDEVIDYAVSLIDEAVVDLPETVSGQAELGRATKPIALSIKAEMLVMSASPLFNGNADYLGFQGKDGRQLFSEYNAEKWQRAATACKEAIDMCERAKIVLHRFQPGQFSVTDSTKNMMNVRSAVTTKWNSEIIWGASNSWVGGGSYQSGPIQSMAMARLSPYTASDETQTIASLFAVPIHIAEMFYSKNGVPIEEDKTYNYSGRYTDIRPATQAERFYIRAGERTVQLNFDREPRFYGSLGFDKGIWYGMGRMDDKATNMWFVEAKTNQNAGVIGSDLYNVTGYWPKKLVHYNGSIASTAYQFTAEPYPWPIMRLADLYLLYAEALNEVNGPSADVYNYLDRIRERSGIAGVRESWTNYSNTPDKPSSKDGLREIIQRERMIELAFEGKRFWDLRRWKLASRSLNRPVQGWNYRGNDETSYYKLQTIYQSTFTQREYFWPLSEGSLNINTNLSQNPGW